MLAENKDEAALARRGDAYANIGQQRSLNLLACPDIDQLPCYDRKLFIVLVNFVFVVVVVESCLCFRLIDGILTLQCHRKTELRVVVAFFFLNLLIKISSGAYGTLFLSNTTPCGLPVLYIV